MTALSAVMALVIYNAFFSFDRKFTLLYSPKYQICYLISNDYTYQISVDHFEYAGKKNKGHVSLRSGDFSEGLFKPSTPLNGFEHGYKKLKNYRVREYRINQETILVDNFEMAEKAPMHLVPEKERCEIFLKKFPDQKIIFNHENNTH